VIALAGHVTVAVVVRLPKHVLCAGAMVIVGETVGRRAPSVKARAIGGVMTQEA
jgi:hypothetical protein